MTLLLIVKATLILAAAALTARLLRRGSAAQRHLVWTLAFVALLTLPWIPQFTRTRGGSASAAWSAVAGAAASAAPAIPWLRWLWLAGAAVALLRLAYGHLRMAGANEVPMAMTWGVLRPAILAPASGLHDLDRRHEQAHVERRDGLWQLIAQLACAVYWFHPFVWLAQRRAAEERERACDDRVLAEGIEAPDYAQRLIDAARALPLATPAAALAVADETSLTARVQAILDPALNRRRLRLRDLACGLALAAALVAPLAPLAAQAAETKPKLIYKVEPKYSEEGKAAQVEGTVKVAAVVTAAGEFTDVEIESGLGYGLDEKAIEAIEQWRAEPATKDGQPVEAKVHIEVNFKLM